MAWPTVYSGDFTTIDPQLELSSVTNYLVGAHTIEGTHTEPTTGQIWPR